VSSLNWGGGEGRIYFQKVNYSLTKHASLLHSLCDVDLLSYTCIILD